MTDLHAEPDFEAAVIAYLTRSESALIDLVPAERISTKLRRRENELLTPAFRLWRVGGLPTDDVGHLIRARFQCEAYADSTVDAFAIASAADLELRRIVGRWGNVVFTGAGRKELGIQNAPDPDSNAERYLFGPVLYGHAPPA